MKMHKGYRISGGGWEQWMSGFYLSALHFWSIYGFVTGTIGRSTGLFSDLTF